MAKIIIGAALVAAAVVGAIVAPELLATVPAWLTAVLASVASTGVSMTVAGIAQKIAGNHNPGTGVAIRQASAPRNVVYGRSRLGGVMIYATDSGFRNGWFRCVVAHTGHEVQAVSALYLDGKLVKVNSSGDALNEFLYDWQGTKYNWGNDSHGPWVHWEFRLGTSPQASFADLNAYDTNWTEQCACDGCAVSYIRLLWDASDLTDTQATFPNGVPGIRVDLLGKNDIYDPRTGLRGYTENWALIIADFLCTPKVDGGLGCDYATQIDEDVLIAAANICDEQVPLRDLSYSAWAANSTYPLNATVEPTTPNGFAYTCVNSGSSGGTEPVWPTTIGASVNDTASSNPAEWLCVGRVTGRYEPRYAINGSYQLSGSPGDRLNNLMTAAAGRVTWVGGVYKIWPAAWYGVGQSIGDEDLCGPIKWVPNRKLRDLVNAVKGTFVCPTYPYITSGPGQPLNSPQGGIFDGMWQETDFPVYQSAGVLCEDAGIYNTTDRLLWADATAYNVNDCVICLGNPWICIAAHTSGSASQPGNGASWATYWKLVTVERLWQELRLAFTISTAAAQRIAKIYVMRNRMQGTGTLQCKLTALQTEAIDVIEWTNSALEFTDKQVEVTNYRYVPTMPSDEKEAPRIHIELDLQETSPAVYAWSTAEELILYAPNAPIPLGAQ